MNIKYPDLEDRILNTINRFKPPSGTCGVRFSTIAKAVRASYKDNPPSKRLIDMARVKLEKEGKIRTEKRMVTHYYTVVVLGEPGVVRTKYVKVPRPKYARGPRPEYFLNPKFRKKQARTT